MWMHAKGQERERKELNVESYDLTVLQCKNQVKITGHSLCPSSFVRGVGASKASSELLACTIALSLLLSFWPHSQCLFLHRGGFAPHCSECSPSLWIPVLCFGAFITRKHHSSVATGWPNGLHACDLQIVTCQYVWWQKRARWKRQEHYQSKAMILPWVRFIYCFSVFSFQKNRYVRNWKLKTMPRNVANLQVPTNKTFLLFTFHITR